jgi:hypothetical protein
VNENVFKWNGNVLKCLLIEAGNHALKVGNLPIWKGCAAVGDLRRCDTPLASKATGSLEGWAAAGAPVVALLEGILANPRNGVTVRRLMATGIWPPTAMQLGLLSCKRGDDGSYGVFSENVLALAEWQPDWTQFASILDSILEVVLPNTDGFSREGVAQYNREMRMNLAHVAIEHGAPASGEALGLAAFMGPEFLALWKDSADPSAAIESAVKEGSVAALKALIASGISLADAALADFAGEDLEFLKLAVENGVPLVDREDREPALHVALKRRPNRQRYNVRGNVPDVRLFELLRKNGLRLTRDQVYGWLREFAEGRDEVSDREAKTLREVIRFVPTICDLDVDLYRFLLPRGKFLEALFKKRAPFILTPHPLLGEPHFACLTMIPIGVEPVPVERLAELIGAGLDVAQHSFTLLDGICHLRELFAEEPPKKIWGPDRGDVTRWNECAAHAKALCAAGARLVHGPAFSSAAIAWSLLKVPSAVPDFMACVPAEVLNAAPQSLLSIALKASREDALQCLLKHGVTVVDESSAASWRRQGARWKKLGVVAEASAVEFRDFGGSEWPDLPSREVLVGGKWLRPARKKT